MIKSFRFVLLYLIEFSFGLIEILLTLRFIFKILGASDTAFFVNWVFINSHGLIVPFEGAFPTPMIRGGFVIEFSSLLALLVFGIVGYFLVTVITLTTPQNKEVK